MPRREPVIRTIADTSLWTAALRAVESERPDALFSDPYARRLAGERGFDILRAIKSPAVRLAVALRTVAIDRMLLGAIREREIGTVLNLAAGLDARAWRLDLPAELRWIDVDLPAVVEYKAEVLADENPRCAYEPVPLDLSDRERLRALLGRIGEDGGAVLVLTEGLLSYLEPELVGHLADDLHEQAHFTDWITDITGSNVLKNVKGAGDRHRPEDAKTRFAPAEGTGFFEPHGWEEAEFCDLFMQAAELGRDGLLGKVLRAAARLMPDGKGAGLKRSIGIVRLTPRS